MVALPNELFNDATRPLSDRLAQSTQKAQMLQTVFNIGYEKFEDTQCRFFQAQSKSNLGNRGIMRAHLDMCGVRDLNEMELVF